MDSNFYSEFIEITKHPNLADAADKLALSTSALSRHIQTAETEVGVALFDRTSRGIVLNNFGMVFLSYCQQIVSIQEDYTNELKKMARAEDTALTISCDFQISTMLSEFLKRNSNYKIKVLNTGTGLSDLINNRCNCAITDEMCLNGEPKRMSNIISIPFSEDHFCIVVPAAHWLARQRSTSLKALVEEQFILVQNPITHDPVHQDLFESAGFEPKVSITVRTYDEAIRLAADEIGITIVPSDYQSTSTSNVTFVDIAPKISRTFYLRYRKGTALSSGAKAFIKFVQDKNLQ